MRKQPIGVLDSGVGGLTVTKTLLEKLPNESFIYIGDVKGYPYGDKTLLQSQEFILKATDFLYEQGVKLIVFACNTATAAALEAAKERYPIPVIGVIEPTSRLASVTTKNNRILLLATEGTVKSDSYKRAITAFNPELIVTSKGCSTFAPFIESGGYHNEEDSYKVIENELKHLKNDEADTIILGCTHFPMLKERLDTYFGHTKTFVDSSSETLTDIELILTDKQLMNDQPAESNRLRVYLTAESQNFENILKEWIPNVDYIFEVIES